MGADVREGYNCDMYRNSDNYGAEARNLLVKIASLMIRHRVELNSKNFIDVSEYSMSADDPQLGKKPGFLGWFQQMIKYEEI